MGSAGKRAKKNVAEKVRSEQPRRKELDPEAEQKLAAAVAGTRHPLAGRFYTCAPLFHAASATLLVACSNSVKGIAVETGEEVFRLDGHREQVTSIQQSPPHGQGDILTTSLDGALKSWDVGAEGGPRCLNTYELPSGKAHTSFVVPGTESCPAAAYVTTQQDGGGRAKGKKRPRSDISDNIRAARDERLAHGKGGETPDQRKKTWMVVCYSLKKKAPKLQSVVLEGTTPRRMHVCPIETGPLQAGGEQEHYVAVSCGSSLWLVSHSTGRKWYAGDSDKPITAMASGAGGLLATGHANGSVTLWRNVVECAQAEVGQERLHKTISHWHAHAVRALCFSLDGRFLFSGGEEAVLVQWNLELGTMAFLARLGAPVVSISISTDGSSKLAVTTGANCVKLVGLAEWAVLWQLQGLTLEPSAGDDASDYSLRLSVDAGDSRTGCRLVLNGEPGALQFFDPQADAMSETLEVAPFNRVSRTDNEKVRPPLVTRACFSGGGGGRRLVTLQKRYEKGLGPLQQAEEEYRFMIKFWTKRPQQEGVEGGGGGSGGGGSFVVETSVDRPHKGAAVTDLAYHPSQDVVASTCSRGSFLVWSCRPRDESDTGPQQRPDSATSASSRSEGGPMIWGCRFAVEYKSRGGAGAAVACAFCNDGSLLAVAFGGVITLWDVTGGVESRGAQLMLTLLSPGSGNAPVQSLAFPAGGGTTLFAQGRQNFVLWDLLSTRTHWAHTARVSSSCVVDAALAKRSGRLGLALEDAKVANVAVCVKLKAGGSCVLLFGTPGDKQSHPERSGVAPAYSWRLPDETLLSMVFVLGDALQGVVGITHKRDVVLLSTTAGSPQMLHKISAPAVSVLGSLVGSLPSSLTNRGTALSALTLPPAPAGEGETVALPRAEQARGAAVLDAATLDLAPIGLLFASYMPTQLRGAAKPAAAAADDDDDDDDEGGGGVGTKEKESDSVPKQKELPAPVFGIPPDMLRYFEEDLRAKFEL